MTFIVPLGQNQFASLSSATNQPAGTSQLVQSLEAVFTQLASVLQTQSGSQGNSLVPGASDAGGNSALVQAFAQALDQVISNVTGQSGNVLESLLANQGGGGPSSASYSRTYFPTGTSDTYSPTGTFGTYSPTGTSGTYAPTGTTSVGAVTGSSAFSENQLYQLIHTSLSQNSDASQNDLSGPGNLS